MAAFTVDIPVKHLNPEFQIGDATVIMLTAELAGIPCHALGEKVGSLKEQSHEIIDALDFLITGF